MQRWAFLFRPSWLVLATVVAAFTYLCFAVLAPWQLGKNTSASRANSQLAHALAAEPVPVTTLLPYQDSAAPAAQWQPVQARGHYLPEAQVLARMRLVGGEPAFEVLAPFVVEGGPTVLVNRGFVRPEQGSQVPPIPAPPKGTVSIVARLRDSQLPIPDRGPVVEGGFTQVYSISTAQIAAVTKVPLSGSYLQLADNQPGGLGAIPLPHIDAGPFLSYGIQWIAFGIMAPILLGYFAYSEIRARRAKTAARGAGDARAVTEPNDDNEPVPMTVEQKLADRYGFRR